MVGKELQCSGTKDVNLICAGFSFKLLFTQDHCLRIQDCEAERLSTVIAAERMNTHIADKLMLCS